LKRLEKYAIEIQMLQAERNGNLGGGSEEDNADGNADSKGCAGKVLTGILLAIGLCPGYTVEMSLHTF
jgi:hypothetical protein